MREKRVVMREKQIVQQRVTATTSNTASEHSKRSNPSSSCHDVHPRCRSNRLMLDAQLAWKRRCLPADWRSRDGGRAVATAQRDELDLELEWVRRLLLNLLLQA